MYIYEYVVYNLERYIPSNFKTYELCQVGKSDFGVEVGSTRVLTITSSLTKLKAELKDKINIFEGLIFDLPIFAEGVFDNLNLARIKFLNCGIKEKAQKYQELMDEKSDAEEELLFQNLYYVARLIETSKKRLKTSKRMKTNKQVESQSADVYVAVCSFNGVLYVSTNDINPIYRVPVTEGLHTKNSVPQIEAAETTQKPVKPNFGIFNEEFLKSNSELVKKCAASGELIHKKENPLFRQLPKDMIKDFIEYIIRHINRDDYQKPSEWEQFFESAMQADARLKELADRLFQSFYGPIFTDELEYWIFKMKSMTIFLWALFKQCQSAMLEKASEELAECLEKNPNTTDSKLPLQRIVDFISRHNRIVFIEATSDDHNCLHCEIKLWSYLMSQNISPNLPFGVSKPCCASCTAFFFHTNIVPKDQRPRFCVACPELR